MKATKITISSIAETLGVSSNSVTRALSGQPGVSSQLRNLILNKASEMGYVKQRNNDTLNILVLHQKPIIQDNGNFSYKVQGIEKAIQEIGAEYTLEFVDKDNQNKLYLPHKLARGNSFDGIIYIGKFLDNYVNFIKQRIKNEVFYDGYSPSIDCDSVWFNFTTSGYKQCEYLIKKGHKSIGFIGNSKIFRNRERQLGIVTAMDDYGINVNEDLFLYIENTFDYRIINFMKKKERPTAIICQWDYTAIMLIKLLYKNGIKVPDDVSVMGSGNTEMSTMCIPELTTLDLNIEYSCKTAVDLLLKRINFPDKPYENIAINSTFIERDSVKNII